MFFDLNILVYIFFIRKMDIVNIEWFVLVIFYIFLFFFMCVSIFNVNRNDVFY